MSSKAKAEVMMPPNTLQVKIGTSNGRGIDPKLIMRAEKVMDELKSEFSEWLTEDITKLNEAFADFSKNCNKHSAGNLFRAAHDLKGQATTFEYPLVARVAASLAKLMDGLKSWDAAPLPLVAAHVDAIRVIHRDKIKDISNLVALTLTEELEGRVVMTLEKASEYR